MHYLRKKCLYSSKVIADNFEDCESDHSFEKIYINKFLKV